MADTLTLSLESPTLGTSSKQQPTSSQAKKTVKQTTVKVGRVGTVCVSSAAIYHAKSASAAKYAMVKSDTPLAIVKEEGEWYGVLMSNGQIGWIKAFNVKETGYDLIAKKPFDRGEGTSRGSQTTRTGISWLDDLVRTASQTSVARYLYGGTNPSTGMDCSAFVRMVFGQYNVKLPRTAREQALVGQTVPFDQLQPGDRLYFSCRKSYIDHCGIYTGNGNFVHCSATRNGVGIDSLASDFFWRSLVVAKRS
ncbi:MAG: C40 family peptidase [Armatimonadota bacterium]|nr:C40 family peptidase [bacterium]